MDCRRPVVESTVTRKILKMSFWRWSRKKMKLHISTMMSMIPLRDHKMVLLSLAQKQSTFWSDTFWQYTTGSWKLSNSQLISKTKWKNSLFWIKKNPMMNILKAIKAFSLSSLQTPSLQPTTPRLIRNSKTKKV